MRKQLHVTWHEGRWRIGEWVPFDQYVEEGEPSGDYHYLPIGGEDDERGPLLKAEIIWHARFYCRDGWQRRGVLGELLVHRKRDGKIGKGRGSRSTYGKDPRESRG